jgi:peroxiredoxin
MYPQPRDPAPDFTLQSSTGKLYELSSFHGRRNLVLIFAGSAGDQVSSLLRGLADQNEELIFEEAQVLVVVRGNLAAAETLRKRDAVTFPVLADPNAALHHKYTAGEAAVVLTDRYGEIYGVYREHLPSIDELMASLRHINAECPE